MGAWHFWLVLQEKRSMPMSFLVLGGGFFFLGGGGEGEVPILSQRTLPY